MAKLNLLASDKSILKFLRAAEGQKIIGADFCYPIDTEVLTRNGWTKFSELDPLEQVWQVNKDTLVGSWVTPSRIIRRKYTGRMQAIKTVRGNLTVTDNHTMLYVGQNHKTRKDKTNLRWVTKSQDAIPTTGCHLAIASTSVKSQDSEEYSDKDIWLAAMLQADGSYRSERDCYRLQVSKPRKRLKIKELLGHSGVVKPPRGMQTLETETWSYVKPENDKLKKLMPIPKFFDVRLICRSKADVVFQALSFWDGCITRSGVCEYSTSSKQQADTVQEYFVTAGFEARVSCNRLSLKDANHKDCFTVTIRKKDRLRIRQENKHSFEVQNIDIGCVTVPSGFILVRQEGQTFVCGNCAVEPHVIAHFSKCPHYRKLYGKGANPNHDVYIYVGMAIPEYRKLFEPHYDIDNPTKEGIEYIKKHYSQERQVCKICHLSMVYGAWPNRVFSELQLKGVDISLKEVKKIHRNYWKMFKVVKNMSRAIEMEWEKNGGWLVSGRGVPFAISNSAIAEDALSRFVQRTAHQYTMRWIYLINQLRLERKVNMAPFVVDLHDATYWRADDAHVDAAVQVIEDAITILNDELQLDVWIKGDIKVGDNFSIAA